MCSVVFNYDKALLNLFGSHFFDDLLQTDCSVRIAADSRERIPSVPAYKVRSGHSAADFVIPANTRLGTWVTTQTGTQIPFKGSNVIALHACTQRIHTANEFLRIGIAGLSHWVKNIIGTFVFATFHHVFCIFNIDSKYRS